MTDLDLRHRIQEVNFSANRPAQRLFDNDEDTALVYITDTAEDADPTRPVGYLTATTDGMDGWAVAVFDHDGWQRGVPDALLCLATDTEVVTACEYLLGEQPEGTDWSAWAIQRINDAGAELGQP